MIELGRHPISIVYDLSERYGFDLTISFSEYFYRPQTTFDEREVFTVAISDVSPAWVQERIARLRDGWELALNSLVTDKRGRSFHIPMMDFVGEEVPDVHRASFSEVLGRDIARDLQFFFSGRSFHAYAATLLKRGDWVRFMGKLLLLSEGHSTKVDCRWVGHRLLGGYSALRWSANSRLHNQMPERLSPKSLLRSNSEPNSN